MPIIKQLPVIQKLPIVNQPPLDKEFKTEIVLYLSECIEHKRAEIDLSNTEILNEGAQLLAFAARPMKNVEIIDVSTCGITDEGAIKICEEFQRANKYKLKTVNLSNNAITEQSIEAII